MKKALAYVTTAMLLGFAIMILPLALEAGPSTNEPQAEPQFSARKPQSDERLNEDSGGALFYGLAAQPLNLLPSSLIFLSGLLVALSVYVTLKRSAL